LAYDQATQSLERRVSIQDITLREGQQAADVAFSIPEKVGLAAQLVDAGIKRIQAGYAGADEETVSALKCIPGAVVSVLLVAFRDDWRAAAEKAAAAGVDVLMVLFRVAPSQLAAMGITEARALEQIRSAVAVGRELVPEVSFDPSFVTLADPGFLREVYSAAAEAGARRFGVADSTGVASPERIAELVRMVREVTGGGAVGVHCHDDFGLALANTLAGLAAGADLADASVLGLGERAGNCAIEELALALQVLYKVDAGVRLDRMTALAQSVSQATGLPIPAAKAVVGEDVFSQKLDMHVALTQRDPSLLEPYPPQTVGNRRRLRLGVGTGPVAIRAKLAELGLPEVDAAAAAELAAWVNQTALGRKRGVTDAEFAEKAGSAFSQPLSDQPSPDRA
jgi:isopropylmalate/homocitrate/citramalate synthase